MEVLLLANGTNDDDRIVGNEDVVEDVVRINCYHMRKERIDDMLVAISSLLVPSAVRWHNHH